MHNASSLNLHFTPTPLPYIQLVRQFIQSVVHKVEVLEHILDIKHVGEEDPENAVELLLLIGNLLSSQQFDQVGKVVVSVERNPSNLVVENQTRHC